MKTNQKALDHTKRGAFASFMRHFAYLSDDLKARLDLKLVSRLAMAVRVHHGEALFRSCLASHDKQFTNSSYNTNILDVVCFL